MIGSTFWEDLEIDAIEAGEDVNHMAYALIDHWGSSLTEKDLLNLSAYSKCADTPIQCALAKAALSYYQTKNFHPDYIHADMDTTPNKKWWKFWTAR
jgi:hypothetical protein